MLGLNSRIAVLSLQRELSRYQPEPLTAIIPGVQLQRLWRMTAYGENALRATSLAVLVVALLFVAQGAMAPYALAEWSLRLPDTFVAWRELPAIGVVLLAGTLAGVIPAEKAFRNSLSDGLTPRN